MKEIDNLRNHMMLTWGPNPPLLWKSPAHEDVAVKVSKPVYAIIRDQIANPLKNIIYGVRRW